MRVAVAQRGRVSVLSVGQQSMSLVGDTRTEYGVRMATVSDGAAGKRKVCLVFLHGIGSGDLQGAWKAPLETSLRERGYPSLNDIDVYTPRYADLLSAIPSPTALAPPETSKSKGRAEEDQLLWKYEGQQANLGLLLSPSPHGKSIDGADHAVALGLGMPMRYFDQARRYIKEAGLRGAVLQRVIDQIPEEGDAVVVGHSLGSLVAIDLLDHLPEGLTIRGLVTLGSPAGHPTFHKENFQRLSNRFPLEKVESWANLAGGRDPVTLGSGVGHLFPRALDVRVDTGFGIPGHAAEAYMQTDEAALAIGSALGGQSDRALAVIERDPTIPLDLVETAVLMALRYNMLLSRAIKKKDERSRFAEAALATQRHTVDALKERAAGEGRSLPRQFLTLEGERTEPEVGKHLPVEEALGALLALASSNSIAPFEIEVHESTRREALGRLSEDMGLSQTLGLTAFDSLKEARKALRNRSFSPWLLGVAGLGLLVAGPLGLILAAPAGAFGGAAIVGALASFGPGGMIGGLMTAGTLASAGSGATVAALARADSSEQMVEAVVVQQLSSALAFKALKFCTRHESWDALAALRLEVTRELRRVEDISDRKAPSVRELNNKLTLVQRAIDHLTEEELIPGQNLPTVHH